MKFDSAFAFWSDTYILIYNAFFYEIAKKFKCFLKGGLAKFAINPKISKIPLCQFRTPSHLPPPTAGTTPTILLQYLHQTWDERVRVRRSSSKSSRFLFEFEFEFESNEMFEFEFEVRVFSTFFNAFQSEIANK